MGAIWTTGGRLTGSLAEIVGFKLGLVVSEPDLAAAVAGAGLHDLWPGDLDATYRYRSEEYEGLARAVLHHFGDPHAADARVPPVIGTMRSLPDSLHSLAEKAIARTVELLAEHRSTAVPGEALAVDGIVASVDAEYGPDGARIALLFLRRVAGSMLASPWNRMRRTDYPDLVDLHDLFATESVTATLGTFFDQRLVDYLDHNAADLADVNWRRFEGLVGEYLHRAGLRVEMGAGRNDDGIDVRCWLPDAADGDPALLVVQCKRERARTTKTVLKALAADVEWEGATAGLLVTSASWSPGARATAETRAYPVAEVNGDDLGRWIGQMRTPGVGPWLAE